VKKNDQLRITTKGRAALLLGGGARRGQGRKHRRFRQFHLPSPSNATNAAFRARTAVLLLSIQAACFHLSRLVIFAHPIQRKRSRRARDECAFFNAPVNALAKQLAKVEVLSTVKRNDFAMLPRHLRDPAAQLFVAVRTHTHLFGNVGGIDDSMVTSSSWASQRRRNADSARTDLCVDPGHNFRSER
jgi:hypothetical protein